MFQREFKAFVEGSVVAEEVARLDGAARWDPGRVGGEGYPGDFSISPCGARNSKSQTVHCTAIDPAGTMP